MSLTTAYLTIKQRTIWGLKAKGKQEVNIAKELKITRQTVHKAIGVANQRVALSLKEAAELNRIKINTIYPEKGFLSGYSSTFKTQAFVTFSAKNGIQIWFKHEGHCNNCDELETCRRVLIEEALERNFLLTEEKDKIVPSKLADAMFTQMLGEQENVE